MLEVLFEDDRVVRFRTSDRLAELFASFNISFGERRTAAAIGILEMDKRAAFEPYVDYAGCRSLHGIGSFSYHMGPAQLRIGRYCSIATGVQEFGERHPIEHVTTSGFCYRTPRPAFLKAWDDLLPPGTAPVKPTRPTIPALDIPVLEHDVWIGQHAQIARGIKLHTGCVVAAGAVVTKDVPAYAIVAGVPARTIRYRFSENVVSALLSSKWWNLHPRHVVTQDLREPARFLDRIGGIAERYEPKNLTWSAISEVMRAD